MGWVTLSLRKRELKQEHQYYQLRDLQISREKRQLARKKSAQLAELQSEQQEQLLPFKTTYSQSRKNIMDQISDLYNTVSGNAATIQQAFDAMGEEGTVENDKVKEVTGVNKNNSSATSTGSIDQGKLYTYQLQLQDLQTNYTEQVNAIKDEFDTDKQMLEEEVGDEETQLEMEQVDIETQMEAVSQELQAVSEAISNEIQSSTIQLK